MHINPDHYLSTAQGRVFTKERNIPAWQCCFDAFKHELKTNPKVKIIYILIGCQGAGKSTWAKNQISREPENIIFDAILVKQSERLPIIEQAKQLGKKCVAVWFQIPLEVCIKRNAQRSSDEIVDLTALTNVYYALEPPTYQEGFDLIEIIY
ncbi:MULTISPECIES: AAA family ATPase [Acinetobacter]|uniref:AAA family ATPase n=1 Tax=Acinetobacter TaxID=469 RepID=UPI000992304E|nr:MULTISPECIES: AAA family ATPase [Acinetobacter]MCL6243439.1 ATP-binding protein [Acinetobacter amyesii]OOV81466.1 hypothetical protein B1201_10380 [Acinetobacter sp. ANC 5600]